ncbi:MAG: efflux transporter outer membrane subunit [Steroidobacteraceae bacterium]
MSYPRRPILQVVSLALLALATGGCAALHPPAKATAPLREQAPVVASGVAGDWPDAEWWRSYGDPTLDTLITTAIGQAPGIAGADARIRAAEEEVRVAGAALGLTVSAQAQYVRQRLSDNGLFPPSLLGFHWYDQSDIGIAVRYQFDWWGKQRATMEGAIDRSRSRGAERQAATLALAAAVSESYFGWQADSARIALQEQAIALQQRLLGIAEARSRAQLDTTDAALEAQRQLAAQREQLESLRGALQLQVVNLAGILGVTADQLPPLVARPLPRPTAGLPADVGTNLLARRPDIIASRWRVEAALRDTDVQRASFYPDVSLRALVGLSSIDVGRLLRSDSRAPLFGAAIDLPLFDAGLRRARHRAAQASLDLAIAEYDDSVVNGAREAGAAAARITQAAHQRAEREQQLTAVSAISAAATARLAGELTHAGPVLTANLDELAQRDALVQVDLAALLADVQLKQALAGSTTPLPSYGNRSHE